MVVFRKKKKGNNSPSEVIDVYAEVQTKKASKTEDRSESVGIDLSTGDELIGVKSLDHKSEDTSKVTVRSKHETSASGQYVIDSSTQAVFQFWPSFDSTIVTENSSNSPRQKRREVAFNIQSTENEVASSSDEGNEETNSEIDTPAETSSTAIDKSSTPSNMAFLAYRNFFPRFEDSNEGKESNLGQEKSEGRAPTVKPINQSTTSTPTKVVQSRSTKMKSQNLAEQQSKPDSMTPRKETILARKKSKPKKDKKAQVKGEVKDTTLVEESSSPSPPPSRNRFFGKGKKNQNAKGKLKAMGGKVLNNNDQNNLGKQAVKEVKQSKDSAVLLGDKYAVLPKYRDANTYHLYNDLNESFSSGEDTAGSESTETLYDQYLVAKEKHFSDDKNDPKLLRGKAQQKYIAKMTKTDSFTTSASTSTRSHATDNNTTYDGLNSIDTKTFKQHSGTERRKSFVGKEGPRALKGSVRPKYTEEVIETETSTMVTTSSTSTGYPYGTEEDDTDGSTGNISDKTEEHQSPFLCGLLDSPFNAIGLASRKNDDRENMEELIEEYEAMLRRMKKAQDLKKVKRQKKVKRNKKVFEEYSSDTQSEEENTSYLNSPYKKISHDPYPYSTD